MVWCEANEMPEPALYYAHEAGAEDDVTRLFEQLAMAVVFGRRRHRRVMARLVRRGPAAALPDRRPARRLFYFLTGRPEEGARWERAPQTSTAKPVIPDGCASIEPWIGALRTWTCPDGIERMLWDAELTLEQLGPDSWWLSTVQVAAAVAHVLLGDPERARQTLTLAAERADATGASEEETAACAELAFVAMDAGAWEEAATHAGRAVAIVEA